METENRADLRPRVKTNLYLYDQADPTYRVYRGEEPHVSVEEGESDFSMSAWTPQTLRRFAHACLDAADALSDELAAREVPVPSNGRPVPVVGGMS
jgi:hypothetical protein